MGMWAGEGSGFEVTPHELCAAFREIWESRNAGSAVVETDIVDHAFGESPVHMITVSSQPLLKVYFPSADTAFIEYASDGLAAHSEEILITYRNRGEMVSVLEELAQRCRCAVTTPPGRTRFLLMQPRIRFDCGASSLVLLEDNHRA
ncbi:hypothetical protein BIU82_13630 [Arthrobacter sp. SW1]|nr:hypothetical protein BIU82_13630 [Arthrobacter sp. SW1]